MSEQDLVNAVIDLIRYRGGVATRINAGMQIIGEGDGRKSGWYAGELKIAWCPICHKNYGGLP